MLLLKQYTDRNERIPFTIILEELKRQLDSEVKEGRWMALYQFIVELERWDWKELSPNQLEWLWDDIILSYDEG